MVPSHKSVADLVYPAWRFGLEQLGEPDLRALAYVGVDQARPLLLVRQSLDGSDERLRIDRLGEVDVHSGSQTSLAISRIGSCGECDDSRASSAPAFPFA